MKILGSQRVTEKKKESVGIFRFRNTFLSRRFSVTLLISPLFFLSSFNV